MTEPAAPYIDNGTLDPLPGRELPPITLDELRRASVSVPAAPLTSEPTLAHDLAVQAALYSRAVGYTRSKQVLDRQGNPVDITEDLPPDPAAAMKWLAIRRPEQWAEKRTQEFRVVIARLGAGSEREAVGMVIEGEKIPALGHGE